MSTEGRDAHGDRGYVNADRSPRPFPWWYCLLIVGIVTVFFPLLLAGFVDNLFLRRAHLQRWTVIFSVGLLQIVRVLFAWAVVKVAWTWLAWILGFMLIWRIWNTANVWWALLEAPSAPSPSSRSR